VSCLLIKCCKYFVFCSSTPAVFLTKPHLFVILTAIGWFILNIQSDLFWHRCLERQTFGTPRMYTLSLSKSIKRSNYGEFLKVKNVLSMYTMYYRQQRTSTLRIWKVCLHSNMYMRKCTLWSDNTCVFTHFHGVKNANTQLIWSSVIIKHLFVVNVNYDQWINLSRYVKWVVFISELPQ
jgi:hypothetical protein